LLRLWFSPSTRKERVRMSIFIEILQAWQYAEVYLIAIFVASWQLGPISEFMINSYCDSLKDTFAQLVYYGILKEEDAQCFSVQSSIEGGSFVLAAGAVLLALINTFVIKAVVQYFRDNDELEKECLGDEEKCSNSDDTLNSEVDPYEFHACERIHPVPVLFSDTFRWLLCREGDLISGIIPGIDESSFVLQQGSAPSYDEDTIERQCITAQNNDSSGKGARSKDEKERSEFVLTPFDCHAEDLEEEIVLEGVRLEGEIATNDDECEHRRKQLSTSKNTLQSPFMLSRKNAYSRN
jgi:hypothetical protein